MHVFTCQAECGFAAQDGVADNWRFHWMIVGRVWRGIISGDRNQKAGGSFRRGVAQDDLEKAITFLKFQFE